jgi:Clp amino terminal domain, pathogenicity island component
MIWQVCSRPARRLVDWSDVNVVWPLSGLVQGLVAGVVTLLVLAIRAASEARTGLAFADLWTALAVGIAVGVVSMGLTKLVGWRMRRFLGPASSSGSWGSSATVTAQPPDRDRFDKFTDHARRVLTLAQDEAQRFNHNYIGTEHLLLGLARETDGTAARVLGNMGIELAKVRTAVEFIIGRGDTPMSGEVGLTPGAKRVIELAIDDARTLRHHYIGTEHLLLGLLREGEGIGAGVLESLGVNHDRTRAEVLRVTAIGDDPA